MVSSQPTSTTRPVTLPLAARARMEDGVNATLGHFKLSNSVAVMSSLTYVGRKVFSTTMTLRCLPSVRRCLGSAGAYPCALVERVAQAALDAGLDEAARLGGAAVRPGRGGEVEVPHLGRGGTVGEVGREEARARVGLAREPDLPRARAGAAVRVRRWGAHSMTMRSSWPYNDCRRAACCQLEASDMPAG